MEIIIDILKVLLLCALVLGILQLLAKCCKFQLPKWLRWNKVRTWLTTILIVVNLLTSLSCGSWAPRFCGSQLCDPQFSPALALSRYTCNYNVLERNIYTILGKRDLLFEKRKCPYYPHSEACIEGGYN